MLILSVEDEDTLEENGSIQYPFTITFELNPTNGDRPSPNTDNVVVGDAYPMKCSVDDHFSASSSSNVQKEIHTSLDDTFELSQQDIRLVYKRFINQ